MPADDLSDEQHYLDHARAELARMRIKTEALRDSAIGGRSEEHTSELQSH